MNLNKLHTTYRLQKPKPPITPDAPVVKSNWNTLHYLRLTPSPVLNFVIFYRKYSKIWSNPQKDNDLNKIVKYNGLKETYITPESLSGNPLRWWAIHHRLRIYGKKK